MKGRVACGVLALGMGLGAEEFIISYKIVSQNQVVISERFEVAKAMRRRPAQWEERCEIFIEQEEANTTALLLQTHQHEVLECLFKEGVRLRSDGISQGFRDRSISVLLIPPTRVEARFNGDVVTLSLNAQGEVGEDRDH